MGLGVSQAGQTYPLEPPASGVVAESAPLGACPQGRFILACGEACGTLSGLLAGFVLLQLLCALDFC